MTEQKNQLASLFAACWKDEALKARLMADPKAVLAEYDMDVPDGMDVCVGGERRQLRAHHDACRSQRLDGTLR